MRFSSEFKRQISREFLDGRAGMHELARRYSLSRNLIRLWVRKYKAGEFTDELSEAVQIAEYERKIAELERKIGQLTMEVDLLKKGRDWDAQATMRTTRSSAAQGTVHRARMPAHEAGAVNLLLSPAPRDTRSWWRGGSHCCARNFRAMAIGASPPSCKPRG